MSSAMTLTKTQVKKATLPLGKTAHKLSAGHGLYLLINASGKYWRMDYRFNGKRNTYAIGLESEFTPDQATDQCSAIRKLIKAGTDPNFLKKVAKQGAAEIDSFEAVTLEWMKVRGADWAPSTLSKIKARMENDIFPHIGRMKITNVTAPEILYCLRKIEERGTLDTAHRALTECGGVLRYAVATARIVSDPSRDLRGALKSKAVKHFAALTESKDVAQLVRAIDTYRGTPEVCAALKLSALLFQRPGEIRQMLWTDIDWEKAEWRYVVSKNMRSTIEPHVVPLSSQAIEILSDLFKITGHGLERRPEAPRYVFRGARSILRPMSDNAVRLALRNLGFNNEQMSAHGFRAMARSLLEEQGWNESAIERQLSHKAKGPLGDTYARAKFLADRRNMMQAWSDYLDSLKRSSVVVPLYKAA
jgi:integrase